MKERLQYCYLYCSCFDKQRLTYSTLTRLYYLETSNTGIVSICTPLTYIGLIKIFLTPFKLIEMKKRMFLTIKFQHRILVQINFQQDFIAIRLMTCRMNSLGGEASHDRRFYVRRRFLLPTSRFPPPLYSGSEVTLLRDSAFLSLFPPPHNKHLLTSR